jgi:hypothetical protein
MGRKTNIFLLIPLATFAAIIIGFGMYNTICKNSNIPINC